MEKKLKLFIWSDFCPDYNGGMAIAIAHGESEARKLIEKERGFRVHDWGKLEVKRLDQRIARCVSGGG